MASASTLNLSENFLEKLVLNRCLKQNDYYIIISEHCDDRCFESQSHKSLFKLIKNYYRKYGKLPSIDFIKQRFIKKIEENTSESKIDYKQVLIEAEGIYGLEFKEDEEVVRDLVIDFVKCKSAYFTVMESIDQIERTKDVGNIIEKFQKINTISFDQDLGLNYFQDLDKHWEFIMNPMARISSGFKQLDYATNGGFYRDGRCLIVFMGQPGIGKSLILSNLAVNFLTFGLKVAIISLEMCQDVYAQRVDAHLSLLNVNQLQHFSEIAKGKILDFKKVHHTSNLFIKEYPPETINTNMIRAYVEKLIRYGMKPDIVLVDYINLLLPCISGRDSMYERIGTVSRELRALSYILGCPICSATQVNRSGFDTSDVTLANVSESAGIAQTADFVCALFQQEGDREANRIFGKILKNRLGGQLSTSIKSTMEFHIDYETLRLSDAKEVIQESIDSPVNSILSEVVDNIVN